MANLRRYPQVAQADNMTPEDAVMMQQMFQQPAPMEQQMAPNAIPDPNALVDDNGIPQSMFPQQPVDIFKPGKQPSLVEEYIKQLNSPEYKAQLAKMNEQSQAALEQQRQGVQQNEQLVNQLAPRAEGVDWTPGIQLADKLFNTQFGKGYVSPDAYKEKLLALKNQLQTQKKALTDEQLNMLKNTMTGGPLGQLKTLGLLDYQGRFGPGGPIDQLQLRNLDRQQHKAVLAEVDKDPIQRQRVATYGSIQNAMNNFFNAEHPQLGQLKEMEQAIASSLNIKGTGGVDERDARYLKTLAGSITAAQQYWKSLKGTDIQKNQAMAPVIAHLKDVAIKGLGNFRKQYEERMKSITAGNEDVYERHPEWKAALENKINAAMQQFSGAPAKALQKPTSINSATPIPEQPSQGPKVGDVEEGHRFLGGDPADAKNWEQVK